MKRSISNDYKDPKEGSFVRKDIDKLIDLSYYTLFSEYNKS